MKIAILTLFPELFKPVFSTSILDRAVEKKLFEFSLVDIRRFGEGTHKTVDGRPYGGGPGMILRADILAKAWSFASELISDQKNKPRTVLMSASGKTFKQAKALELSRLNNLIIICGHYEGVDQRFSEKYVDEEISIGDYILTGGEIPAIAVTDAIVRLLPGVLKKAEATEEESFSPVSNGQLEYPQFTRPETFEGLKVPDILRSGNHQRIKEWRQAESLQRTKEIRPDLINCKSKT